MVPCQDKPSGHCSMDPPCLPGECYLYEVSMREHADINGAVAEDPGLARELTNGAVPFARDPYTENEPWDRTRLGLVNALLDTLVPGARLVVDGSDGSPRVSLGRVHPFDRPRDLPRTLRELADCLDGGSDG